jgi:translation initiation factor IF-3
LFRKPFFTNKNRTRINEWIKAPEIRVITEDAQQLGVMKTADALILARQRGLDLVEITDKANPPVCKIIDFGKFQYQKEKRAKEVSKSHRVEVKNIRLSFNIAEHDLTVKAAQAEKFLTKGDRARIQIVLRGREKAFAHLAKQKLEDFKSYVKIPINVDQPITREPRGFYMLISKGK